MTQAQYTYRLRALPITAGNMAAQSRTHTPANDTLTISLQRIKDLFTPPSQDPFQNGFHIQSGIEQIIAVQRGLPRHSLRLIIIHLPAAASQDTPPLAEVQAAVTRYCTILIHTTQQELTARRHTIQRNVVVGIGILAASLGLATVISNSTLIGEGIRALLSNSISILGSVALWSPLDAYLFGLRPLRKSVNLYTEIEQMTFTIQFGSGD